MKPTRSLVTGNGCALFRWPVAGDVALGTPPVILAHGLFTNHRPFRSAASYLCRRGHDVWSFDFRGHGDSAPAARRESFESVCLADVESVLDAVLRHTGAPAVSWVGHSGGGLALLMYLARCPERQCAIERMVLAASQATGACATVSGRLKVLGILAAMHVLPLVSGPRFGLGPEPERRAVLAQWCRWNLSGRWLGEDGFDYLRALEAVRVPHRVLAGAADRFIAPPQGCRRLHDALGGTERTYTLCGPQTGYSAPFGHAGLLFSKVATGEVWPSLAGWLGSTCPIGRTAVPR